MSRYPMINGMGPLPWFAGHRNPEMGAHVPQIPPFPVSEFIKHAAQQQLQAQLKVKNATFRICKLQFF